MLQARWFVICVASLAAAAPAQSKTMAEVLAASKPADWRPLDPANTLYVEWDAGRVVIELAPEFAPGTIANVKTLVRQKYFDGLAFIRSQDNYVVQWGDPAEAKRSLGAAKKTVPASAGTLPTHNGLFVGLLIGVILIVGGLTYFPALAVGPIVEHFAMLAGQTF